MRKKRIARHMYVEFGVILLLILLVMIMIFG